METGIEIVKPCKYLSIFFSCNENKMHAEEVM